MGEWDYSTPYCDACAELELTSCSCEPDGFEEVPTCGNCGEDMPFSCGDDLCDECEEELYDSE